MAPSPLPGNPFFLFFLISLFPSHPLKFQSWTPYPKEGAVMGSSSSSPSLFPSPFPCSPPHPGFSPGHFQGGIPGSGPLIRLLPPHSQGCGHKSRSPAPSFPLFTSSCPVHPSSCPCSKDPHPCFLQTRRSGWFGEGYQGALCFLG